jgi:hypothetical protein
MDYDDLPKFERFRGVKKEARRHSKWTWKVHPRCPDQHKQRYSSKAKAEQARIRSMSHAGGQLRVYYHEKCSGWHLTSKV